MTNDDVLTLEAILKLMKEYGVTRLTLRDREAEGDMVDIEMPKVLVGCSGGGCCKEVPPEVPRAPDPMLEDLKQLEADRKASEAALNQPLDEACGCSPSKDDPHFKEIHHSMGGCLFGCDIAKCAQPLKVDKSS